MGLEERILAVHSNGQLRDDLHHSRSSGGPPFAGPFLGDELPVPAEDRVGGNDGGDLGEDPATEGVALGGEPAEPVPESPGNIRV